MIFNKKNKTNIIFVCFIFTCGVLVILNNIKNVTVNKNDKITVAKSNNCSLVNNLTTMNSYKYPMPSIYNPHPSIRVPFLHSTVSNWKVPPSYVSPSSLSHIFYMAPANPPPFGPID